MKNSSSMMMQLIALLLLPLAAQAQEAAQAGNRSQSTAWTAADYGFYTPASFSQHPAARQVMDRENMDHALLNAALFFATNTERLRHRLLPFQPSRALTESAFEHSRDMALRGFFSHQNPKDAAKRTPWQRMAAKGVTGGHRAENIAMRTVHGTTYLAAANAIVQQWMKSPGHRANILNPKFTHVGCGAHFCLCAQSHLHATQNFASAVPSSATGRLAPLPRVVASAEEAIAAD